MIFMVHFIIYLFFGLPLFIIFSFILYGMGYFDFIYNKYSKRFQELSEKLLDINNENESINKHLMTVDFYKDLEPWFIDKLIALKNKENEFKSVKKKYQKLKMIMRFMDFVN